MAINQVSESLDQDTKNGIDQTKVLAQRLKNPPAGKAGGISNAQWVELSQLVSKFKGANGKADFKFDVIDGQIIAQDPKDLNKAKNLLIAFAKLVQKTEEVCASSGTAAKGLLSSGFVQKIVTYSSSLACNAEVGGALEKDLANVPHD